MSQDKIMRNFCAIIAAFVPLASHGATSSFICKFEVEASPKGLAKQSKPFELRFVVDNDTNKAYLMGNAGSAEVEIIPNSGGISFLEITDSGNVMVTAVTKNGEAVHSRNGIMSKELVPSQLYGSCFLQ
ncbi:hypothetical protein [Methylomonas sp. TEB]|uniref:hypothetical protein n=1 Tax=Methylomonas sp. TEB TaxID=3398229 RepID=UPI0039F48D2E